MVILFSFYSINRLFTPIYLKDICEIIFNFILILKYFLRMSNRIGKRGENIFATTISRNVASRGFLFDPTFLGEKFPTIDFHVDLLQYPYRAFFYASVKITTLGYYPGNERIKITIGKEEVAELGKFLTPAYIIGIDETQEKGYLISVNNLNSSSFN